MLNGITKSIKKVFLDDDAVVELIRDTLAENKKYYYRVAFVNRFDADDVRLMNRDPLRAEVDDDDEAPKAITFTYNHPMAAGANGCILFNVAAIQKDCAGLGYFDARRRIKSIVLDELRHINRLELLRKGLLAA